MNFANVFFIFVYGNNNNELFNVNCNLFLLRKVSKYWNILALDGSNWQKIDLFYFQIDIEVSRWAASRVDLFMISSSTGSRNRKHFATLWRLLEIFIAKRMPECWRSIHSNTCTTLPQYRTFRLNRVQEDYRCCD